MVFARHLLLAVCLASAAALAAGVVDDPRLDGARPAIAAAIDAAQHDGLPADRLSDKVAEGLAKGVPPQRIAQAVQSLASALGDARAASERELKLSRAAVPPALVVALAEARLGGVQQPEIDRVLASAGRAHLDGAATTRAAAALSDLVARGFPAATSSRTVESLIARGAGSEAFDRLGPSASRRLRELGGSPDQALDDAAHGGDHGDHDPNPHSAADDHGPNRDTSGQRGPHGNNGKGKN